MNGLEQRYLQHKRVN